MKMLLPMIIAATTVFFAVKRPTSDEFWCPYSLDWNILQIARIVALSLVDRFQNSLEPIVLDIDAVPMRNHVGQVGTALFDLDSKREAWEVVLGKTHFVIKPNKKLAPELHSRLCVDVIIDKRKHELQCSNKDLETVLLHNMVNCNRVLSRGPNAKTATTELFEHIPIRREQGRKDVTVMIQSQTFRTFEGLIKKWTITLAGEYKEIGWFTQGSEFQTFDSPENLKRSGPVARMPSRLHL